MAGKHTGQNPKFLVLTYTHITLAGEQRSLKCVKELTGFICSLWWGFWWDEFVPLVYMLLLLKITCGDLKSCMTKDLSFGWFPSTLCNGIHFLPFH